MIRLIRGDLGRILKKKSFYVLIILNAVLILVRWNGESAAEQIDNAQKAAAFLGLTLACVAIFSAVYGDEQKSGSMQAVIGRGLSRKKVVLGKLIDSAILLFFTNVLFYLCELINILLFPEFGVSSRQISLLFLYFVFVFLRGVGYIAFSALFLFASDSIASGMVVLITCCAFGKLILQWAQDKTRLPVYDLCFDGLLDRSYAVFQSGGFGWQLFIALLVFGAGSTAVTVLIFNRKELEL